LYQALIDEEEEVYPLEIDDAIGALGRIKSKHLLTAEQELDLSRRAKKGDREARDRLITSNIRLVISIAKRYNGIPMEDRIQEGIIGLQTAVDKFDPEKGFRFTTYATWWIRRCILREIMNTGNLIRLPVYIHQNRKKFERELASPDTSPKKRQRLQALLETTDLNWSTLSLDAILNLSDSHHDALLIDAIPDPNGIDRDEVIARQVLREQILKLFECLTERERECMILRFGFTDDGAMTLEETSAALGITRERVRQIVLAAIRKIERAPAYTILWEETKKLRDMVENRI
jgi:RNA polymerase primary sigma factor